MLIANIPLVIVPLVVLGSIWVDAQPWLCIVKDQQAESSKNLLPFGYGIMKRLTGAIDCTSRPAQLSKKCQNGTQGRHQLAYRGTRSTLNHVFWPHELARIRFRVY